MSSGSRKPFWLVFLTGSALVAMIAWMAPHHGGLRAALRANDLKIEPRTSLYDVAAQAPDAAALISPTSKPPVAPPTATPAQIPVDESAGSYKSDQFIQAPPQLESHADDDLRSSRTRLDMIDQTGAYADQLFTAEGGEPEWSVNPQDMDQQDYKLDDGTQVTAWFGTDDGGQTSAVRAQEAQLPNGEVIDRWYSDDGTISQVSHQYDAKNSFGIYYYPDGRIEATRTIKDGAEIFTKYAPDGRQLEKTYTPSTEH